MVPSHHSLMRQWFPHTIQSPNGSQKLFPGLLRVSVNHREHSSCLTPFLDEVMVSPYRTLSKWFLKTLPGTARALASMWFISNILWKFQPCQWLPAGKTPMAKSRMIFNLTLASPATFLKFFSYSLSIVFCWISVVNWQAHMARFHYGPFRVFLGLCQLWPTCEIVVPLVFHYSESFVDNIL